MPSMPSDAWQAEGPVDTCRSGKRTKDDDSHGGPLPRSAVIYKAQLMIFLWRGGKVRRSLGDCGESVTKRPVAEPDLPQQAGVEWDWLVPFRADLFALVSGERQGRSECPVAVVTKYNRNIVSQFWRLEAPDRCPQVGPLQRKDLFQASLPGW
ncbi:uncharacterized protein AAES06_010053 isoform 1-T3 [Glossophaga mutica]